VTSVVMLLRWRHVGQRVNAGRFNILSEFMGPSVVSFPHRRRHPQDARVCSCRDVKRQSKTDCRRPLPLRFSLLGAVPKGEGPGVAEGTSRACSRPRWEVDARSTGVNEFFVRHVKLDGFTTRSLNSEVPGPQTSNVMHKQGDHISIVLLIPYLVRQRSSRVP